MKSKEKEVISMGRVFPKGTKAKIIKKAGYQNISKFCLEAILQALNGSYPTR